MLFVIPLKEGLPELTGIFDAAEAVGALRSVLQGLKLAFRIRVVVGDMGTTMRFDDAEISHLKATSFDVIGDPLSAWMVSCARGIFC